MERAVISHWYVLWQIYFPPFYGGILTSLVQIYPHGISPARWIRFESYSSKIKTLVIKPENTAMDAPWVSFLESRRPVGMRWFPEVTRLVLACESPLASFISASIIRQVRFFHILITPSTYADVALLNCALPDPWQSTPGVMAGLRIQHVASPQTLLCIPKLGGLRYLYLRISPGTTSQELIHCIGTLTELRRLTIKQDRRDTVPDIPLSTTQGYNAALSRPSRLNDLISLSVDAETAMQCLIAAHISPRSLTSLDLVVQFHRDAVLLPLAIGVHARRNPDLRSLNVQVKADKNVEGVDPSVRTSAVLHTQDFLAAISTPKRIQSFVVEGVPFFSTDIVDGVLGNIHILQELKVFSFLPVSATSFPRDRLKLGSLRSLQKLAECNPALRSIETLIGGDDPPTLPTEYLSKHHLEIFTALSNGRSPKSTQRRLDVAAFLVRVFPRLQTISGAEIDEEGVKAWRKVEKFYFSHRQVGAQAVATDEVVKKKKKKKSKRRNRR
ncbi:hypothetical protein NMY22_g14683 [Coprinellus aureogranulatus]|nr:hypothetical protein NMY22_g14683 [Coprinellus aureogranulatus]